MICRIIWKQRCRHQAFSNSKREENKLSTYLLCDSQMIWYASAHYKHETIFTIDCFCKIIIILQSKWHLISKLPTVFLPHTYTNSHTTKHKQICSMVPVVLTVKIKCSIQFGIKGLAFCFQTRFANSSRIIHIYRWAVREWTFFNLGRHGFVNIFKNTRLY